MDKKRYAKLAVMAILMFVYGCENTSSETEKPASKPSLSSQEDTDENRVLEKDKKLTPNVVIAGKVENGFNASVVLEANTNSGTVRIGQAYTDANGDFSIEGAIEAMGLYQLRLEERLEQGKEPKVVPLTLEVNDSVFIALNFNDFNHSPKYSGTRWAEPMNKYIQEMNKFMEWQKGLQQQNQYDNETLMKMVKKEKKAMDDFSLKSIKNDPSNPINILLMSNLMPMMGFEHWDKEQLKGLQQIKSGFEEAYPDHPMTKNIANQVAQVEKDYNAFIDFTENNIAPEIELEDTEGRVRKLSDLRGKFVLIDFWASWCGPCRMENPNVVRVYNEYKDKNFDIFSVSLDQDKGKWKKAIAADGLSWDNHVSDLKAWSSVVVQSYGIKGIPHTVLINPEGEIVATNLRGNQLEQKLKEVL